MISFAQFADLSLSRTIADALSEVPVRIRMIETPAGRLWLKRTERLSLRWRLQKGSGQRSFEKDRAGLHMLGEAGLPVAPILAEGPDYFVTPDIGITLRALMAAQVGSTERSVAFGAAGRALAALHAEGFSHGRPAVRDLCWDGEAVRFIDMEKFSPRRRSARHFAMDVLVFVHSVFAAGGGPDELDTAVAAYRAAGGPWDAAVSLARRMRWLAWLAGHLQAARPRSRDLGAIAPTLAYVTTAR